MGSKGQLPYCDREFLDAGVRVTRDEKCLKVQETVVADGLLSQEKGDVLVNLGESPKPSTMSENIVTIFRCEPKGLRFTQEVPQNNRLQFLDLRLVFKQMAGPVENDREMYSQRLTDKEVFTGFLTYDVIEHLRYSAEMAPATRVMLAASDRARHFSEAYFQIKRRFYMHLVQTTCRTALNNSSTERADMSHPLHADNCQFQENASCPALNWEFSWRDGRAVVYLNGDAHGGEFGFTKTPRTSVRAIVRPKCGRLVAFSGRNCHGVLPVF
ncbi:prolyl 3-hydroxylase 2-like [Amblyomma americanum]